MSLRHLLCTIAGLALLASPAAAGDTAPKMSMNNLHETLTDCATYYSIAAMCIGNSDAALSLKLKKAQRETEEMSVALAEGLGMSQDAALSRVKLRVSAMLGLMESNCINIGSVISRYATMCKAISEDPIGFANRGGLGR